MTDPDVVKRELSRLASLDPLANRGQENGRHEVVVDDAAEAVTDLDRAAAFRRDGGVPRLRRAIEAAERAADRELARRGQRALAAYERFDSAVAATETGADCDPYHYR